MGHNPNTIEEADAFLRHGANALEPDIVYADGQFYVSHEPQLSYKDVPVLQEYLGQLKKLLLGEQYNLALIVWDIETVNFDPFFLDRCPHRPASCSIGNEINLDTTTLIL